MKIAIGCDHAGFSIKNAVKAHLESKGFETIDVGTNSADSCHYPVYANALCEKILGGEAELGILICGTGIGMSMAANKVKGIRCAKIDNVKEARLAKEHNDANVCVLPCDYISTEKIIEIINTFLTTEFMGGKHQIRVEELDKIN